MIKVFFRWAKYMKNAVPCQEEKIIPEGNTNAMGLPKSITSEPYGNHWFMELVVKRIGKLNLSMPPVQDRKNQYQIRVD
jgi:hypothetical protein